jgi:hypothetical protein
MVLASLMRNQQVNPSRLFVAISRLMMVVVEMQDD